MQIHLLLEKYKNLGFSQKRIKEITVLICEDFGLKLESNMIEVKDFEIKIKISGVKRTHFVLNKNILLKKLQDELQKEGFKIFSIN